ncbi:MAG: preprotein translocase subunit YajC [Gammaproteobacteria bacterium]|jgi:preprotein translocase subunit YajC
MSDFFIQNAWAQGAGAPGGNSSFLIMMIIFFAIFFLLVIRPQMKQQKEHKKMVESLSKGDEVVTSGGMLGRISEVGENFIAVEVAKDTEVKIQKNAVSAVMPKGTLKTL